MHLCRVNLPNRKYHYGLLTKQYQSLKLVKLVFRTHLPKNTTITKDMIILRLGEHASRVVNTVPIPAIFMFFLIFYPVCICEQRKFTISNVKKI